MLLARALAGAGFAIALGACGACNARDQGGPIPYAADASVADAAIVDAAPEIGVPDTAPYDAASFPLPGRWVNIPGMPSACSALMPANPAVDVPSLEWAPCASGRPGCRKLVTNYDSTWMEKVSFFSTEPMRDTPRGRFLVYGRNYAAPGGAAHMEIVQAVDGAPVFAVGIPGGTINCVGNVDVGPAGIAVGLAYSDGCNSTGTYCTTQFRTLATGSLDGVLSKATPLALGGQIVVHTSVGPQLMYPVIASPPWATVFDPATQHLLYHLPIFLGETPRAVIDGALALMPDPPYGIDLLRNDGTYGVLIPAGSTLATRLAIDHANGDAIVWVEDVIYTAPYTTDPSAVQRRAVATFVDPTGQTDIVANAGVVLNVTGVSTAVARRLSDGVGWPIAAEPGDALVRPLWVDDNEIWISTAIASQAYYQDHEQSIMRIDRSTLGSPTVPSGL